jgi:hypothetical protein
MPVNMSYGWISYNATSGLLDLPPAALCKMQFLVLLAFEDGPGAPAARSKPTWQLTATCCCCVGVRKRTPRSWATATPVSTTTYDPRRSGDGRWRGSGSRARKALSPARPAPRSQAPNPDGNVV